MDKRSKEYKDLVKMTPPTSELLSEQIDGETYLYKTSNKCKVCTAGEDIRNLVDTLLMFPKSYAEVLRSIQPLQEKLEVPIDDRLNYENIRNHQRNHLPFDKIAVREIVERRAKEKNIAILNASNRLLTAEAFYEVIAAKGWEDLVSGYTRPTLSQTMQAMDMLSKFDEEAGDSYRPEDLIQQLDIILMAVREVLPPDLREKLFQRIEEYQSANKKANSPKALKSAEEDEDFDYIDDDLI